MLFNPEYESANMIIQDGVILVGALRARVALRHGNHHLARHGQDLGAVRPEGIRQAIAGALSQEKQRRMVPGRPEKGWIERGEVLVHQAEMAVPNCGRQRFRSMRSHFPSGPIAWTT